jgi:poly(A) polymerase
MFAFAIKPCKLIGDIKTVIKDAILDGQIHNDRAEAWALMLETGRKLGAGPVNTADRGQQQEEGH